MKKKKLFVGILLVELVILLLMIIGMRMSEKNCRVIDLPLEEWVSEGAEYSKGKWYVDESMVDFDGVDSVVVAASPTIKLPKGSYTIEVFYECETRHGLQAVSVSHGNEQIKGGTALLRQNMTSTTYRIEVEDDLEDFRLDVRYNNNIDKETGEDLDAGGLVIQNLTMKQTTLDKQRMIAYMALLFLFIDVCICILSCTAERRNILIMLSMIAGFASAPLAIIRVHKGADLTFHFSRIEGLVEGLRMGGFPVKISPFWLSGFGYPASIYYGDILLYIPAMLRVAGVPLAISYMIFIFLINIGTTLISYYSFEKIFKDKKIALITSFAYVTCSYRLINVYLRTAIGEYCAMMFLPLIALAIYGIYTMDEKNWKEYRKNAIILALGMTGLIGTHMLSTEMVVIVLAFICVVLWKKTFRKNTIRVYLLAVGEAILLNLYYIVPFLDYYFNVPVRINETINDVPLAIQENGIPLIQYFEFFQSTFDSRIKNCATPGLLLMLVLVIAIGMFIKKKLNKESKFYLILVVILLFVASEVFPWDALATSGKIGNMIAQIQFPWRYIGIVCVVLTLLLGSVVKLINWKNEKQKHKIYIGMIAIGVVMTSYFYCDYVLHGTFLNYYDRAELTTNSIGHGEYIRVGTDSDNLGSAEILYGDRMEALEMVSREGCRMDVYCETGSESGSFEVPMFNYKGYRAMDEQGNEYPVTDGNNNVIRVTLPEEYEGTITIDFVEPWYWRVAEIGTLLMFLILLEESIRKKCGKKIIVKKI